MANPGSPRKPERKPKNCHLCLPNHTISLISSKKVLLLQYASGTLNGEVTKDVIEFSYCDNAHPLNNKEDMTQLYSTVVEFSHYHRNSSTKENKECERNNHKGTIGTIK